MLCTIWVVFLLFHRGSTMDTKTESGPRFDPDEKDAVTKANEVVAFSAELSSRTDLLGDSTIEFDRVLANVGERYFGNTGQFACADDRLYVFIWSLVKDRLSGVEGMRCISKLRSGVTDHKYGPKSSYYNTSFSGVAEMTAILQCTTSPLTAVTIETVPWSQEVGSIARFYSHYTSFSGFRLLHEIAFTAELSQDQYLFAGSKIRFDRVLSNHGGHYDDIGHMFHCPDDGVYVFSISTHTRDPATPWSVSRLMKDGEVVTQGPITFRATADYDSGSASTTTVLQCTPGSSVYVEAQAAHDFPHNSYGAELTSFTGFKLYDDVEGAVAFTAIMSNNHTAEYDHQRLVFDQIVTNVGNGFDTDRSEFLCPDDNYYLFTWTTVANYGGGYSNTELYMDNNRIKYSYLSPTEENNESGTSGSSSISVIRQCAVGNRLYVVWRHEQDRVYLGGYTSFSGYKIPY